MNKFFTKIAAAFVGMTMAIGVGVAVASGSEAVPVDAKSSDEVSESITFKTSSGDASSTTAAGNVLNNLAATNSLVASCDSASRVYAGKNGIKFGTSSATGNVTFTIKNDCQSYVKTIVLGSTKYSSDTGKLKLTMYNGSNTYSDKPQIVPGSTGSDATYTFTNSSTVTKIKIETTSNRAYLGSITFTFEKPASVDLAVKSGSSDSIKSSETTTLVATPVGSASGTYSWSASPSGVLTFTNANSSEMTFTGANVGTATVTVTLGSYSDTLSITVSRMLDSLEITTKPSTLVYTEGQSFSKTGMVVKAHYLGTDDLETLDNNDLTVSPSGALGTSNDHVTISYTEDGVTKTVDQSITVNAIDYNLDSLTWSATNISVYSGEELTSTQVAGFAVEAVWEEDVENTPLALGVYTLTIGDDTITTGNLPFTWTTAHDGKKLTATYTNNGRTKSVSVDVEVTETLNTILSSTASLVTDASTLRAGDHLIIASRSNARTAGDLGEEVYLASISSTFNAGLDQITSIGSGTMIFTLGGSSGSWTFANSSGEVLGATGNKKLAWDDGTTTWSISISSGDATISNGTSANGRFLYNVTSPRFVNYSTSTSTSSNMKLPQLYKVSTWNNVNKTAQRAALNFVKTFNSTLDCNINGGTANLASKWETVVAAFSSTRPAGDDSTAYNNLFKYADSAEVVDDGEGHGITPVGDSLQKMLAKYNYLVDTLGMTDFLHEDSNVARAAVSAARVVSLNGGISISNNSATLIIVIVSFISLSAIVGYVILRRRKEQ